MNDTFAWKRFTLFAKQQYSQNNRFYFISSLLLLVGFAVVFWCFWSTHSSIENWMPLLYIGSLVGMAQHLSYTMRDYKNRKRSIRSLCLPVSGIEQFAFLWINTLVVFTVSFFGIFWIVNLSMGLLFDYSMTWIVFRNSFLGDSLMLLLMVHAAVLFTMLYSWKRPWGGILILGVYFALLSVVSAFLQRIGVTNFSFYEACFPAPTSLLFQITSGDTTLSTPIQAISNSARKVVTDILLCAWPMVLWTASYFAFKEQQSK